MKLRGDCSGSFRFWNLMRDSRNRVVLGLGLIVGLSQYGLLLLRQQGLQDL